ncbi:MAG: hypothetical protein AB2809_07420 [Candidatus Thiodiazotropha sp.]
MKKNSPMLFIITFIVSLLLSNLAFALDIYISSPPEGGSVNQRHNVIGGVSDPTAKIIIVVHPVSVSEFWTQPPVTVRNDGQWHVKAHFGRQEMDHGEEYEVRAYANPQSQIIEGKYNSWPEAEARSNVVIVTRR